MEFNLEKEVHLSKNKSLNLSSHNISLEGDVPVTIFRMSLSPLETIVRYLKEISNYKFSQIAVLLSRSHTTIWTTYNNSKKKNEIILFETIESNSKKK